MKCYIFTGYIEENLKRLDIGNDFLICADKGYEKALENGFYPDVVIGDFDSIEDVEKLKEEKNKLLKNKRTKILKYSAEKDETDTLLAVQYALEKGFDEITIVGGLGGRLDHTMANIQTMAFVKEYWKNQGKKNNKICICDEKNWATVLENEEIVIESEKGKYLSLISFGDKVEIIETENLKWDLKNAILENSYPLGVSNQIERDKGRIKVGKGKLLVIISQD